MTNLTAAKFNANGDFNRFLGNTVVANLYDNEELMDVVATLQKIFSGLPFKHKLTLTPAQSIHMTVMELLCDQNRQPDYWSKFLPLDLPIEQVSAFFGRQLCHFPLKEEDITMRVKGLGELTICLEPANEASRQRLGAVRQYISYQTGVFFPNHTSYQFHITFGYCHQELTPEEAILMARCQTEASELLLKQLTQLTISRIDFTTFEDMTAFIPYQEDRGEGPT